MTYKQYVKCSLALQNAYNLVNLKEKVCEERVDFLVDLCCLQKDYIHQLEAQLRDIEA